MMSRRKFSREFKVEGVRRQESRQSVAERPLWTTPPTHRRDEFPTGYSLAGCAPAEPASASPADQHLARNQSRRTMTFQRTAICSLTGCLRPGVHRNTMQRPRRCNHHKLFLFRSGRCILRQWSFGAQLEIPPARVEGTAS